MLEPARRLIGFLAALTTTTDTNDVFEQLHAIALLSAHRPSDLRQRVRDVLPHTITDHRREIAIPHAVDLSLTLQRDLPDRLQRANFSRVARTQKVTHERAAARE
jgi:hypothetical protein